MRWKIIEIKRNNAEKFTSNSVVQIRELINRYDKDKLEQLLNSF